jgi:hypothetical protein
VSVSLKYRIVFSEGYGPDECAQALVTIDGNYVGDGPGGEVEELCGVGSHQDTGWEEVTFDVELRPGVHTITLGGWNNKKTFSSEISYIYFDDIEILQQ